MDGCPLEDTRRFFAVCLWVNSVKSRWAQRRD
jgi:hypothetical protein